MSPREDRDEARPSPPEADDEIDACRRLIVDGMNALGSRPDGWWRDRPRAMAALVTQLGHFASGHPAIAVEVVFDGRPHATVAEAGTEAGVAVAFAGSGANAADREIAAMVREDERPDGVLVVSSDRRLRAAVKAAGGHSTGAGGFVSRRLA